MLEQLSSLFINNAYADPAGAAPPPANGSSLILMVVIFMLFIYFTVWRPQNKRAKEQRNLLNSLAKGDEVVTIGGILGKINKLQDNYLVLGIADNVEITVQKSSVATVLPKGTLKSI